MTPYESDDLTEVVEREGGGFVVLWSLETAEHEPDYCELGRFTTRAEADAFLASRVTGPKHNACHLPPYAPSAARGEGK